MYRIDAAMSNIKDPAKMRTVEIMANSNIAVTGSRSHHAGISYVCHPFAVPKEYSMRALMD